MLHVEDSETLRGMMKKKVAEIPDVKFGQYNISSEPSCSEIAKAIEDRKFENREFQKDIKSIDSEANRKAGSEKEYCNFLKQYHARRIAYFVVHGWKDPIVLRENGTVKDGLHRLKAAIYKGVETIDVTTDLA